MTSSTHAGTAVAGTMPLLTSQVDYSELNAFLLVIILVILLGVCALVWKLTWSLSAMVADFGRFLDYQAELLGEHPRATRPSHRRATESKP